MCSGSGSVNSVSMSFQKMFGLYGLKHHIAEKSDVTDAGRTDERTNDDNEQGKIGLLSLWAVGGLSFAT